MAEKSTIDTKSLVNYTKEAFSLPINLGYLAVAALTIIGLGASSSAIGFPTWQVVFGSLTAFAGAEMLYLSLMPQNRRFRRAVNANRQPVTQRLQAQVKSLNYLTLLGKASLEKYAQLYRKKGQISANVAKSSSTSESFVDAYVAKINTLEAFYVELLFDIDQYRQFLTRESLETLNAELQKLKAEMAQATSPKVVALYQKRQRLIDKRIEKNAAVRENLQMAEIQVATLEDTVDYLLEQSMTIKNPDEISRVIDSVLSETEEQYQSLTAIQSMTEPDYLIPELAEEAEQEEESRLPPDFNQLRN